MLEIDTNGNLKVNRGDTFEIPLFIDIGDNIFTSTRFHIRKNDILYFHLLEANAPWNKPLIRKEFTYEDENENNDIIIRFNHEDTCWLFPGIYYYEIKLQRPNEPLDDNPCNDDYVTIVPRRKFIIQ